MFLLLDQQLYILEWLLVFLCVYHSMKWKFLFLIKKDTWLGLPGHESSYGNGRIERPIFYLFLQFLCLGFGFEIALFSFCFLLSVFFYFLFFEFLLSKGLLVLVIKINFLGKIGEALNGLSFMHFLRSSISLICFFAINSNINHSKAWCLYRLCGLPI